MNPWYENLIARCYEQHDLECEQGADCPNRRQHVERHYVPTALRERVEQAEARIQAVQNLIDEADTEGNWSITATRLQWTIDGT